MTARGPIIGRLVPTKMSGNRARHVVELGDAPSIVIGRGPNNQVVLDDPEVSKRHAEIAMRNGVLILRDLDSSNGTFVNGKQIRSHVLDEGDEVEIGACFFRFTQEGDVSEVTLSPQGAPDSTKILASTKVDDLVAGSEIRDLDQLRGRYDRVRTAFHAVRRLVETTDIQRLCEGILDVAFQLLRAQTGVVMLFDDAHELVPWARRSSLPPGTANFVISRTVANHVIETQQGVLASDALSDSRWASAHSIVSSGVRSLMCVPLVSGERIYGILHIANVTEVGAFHKSDLELISGIGTGAGVALANAFLAHQLAEEARTREQLGRFLSPQLVDQVVQHQVRIERGGEERQVTVMFADIRGFTSMSEKRRAVEIVSLLNEYFDQMVEVVFQHGGSLDKFIGDALMAVWGTPIGNPDDAARAVAAAKEMQHTLQSLNEFRRDRGEPPIGVGIGLATGVCVAGAIGARRRMDYTVIGDRVNLAARLASVAQAGEVLCDEETYQQAGPPEGALRLPPTQVKGKQDPVPIYRVSIIRG